jgi:hypothetical protein
VFHHVTNGAFARELRKLEQSHPQVRDVYAHMRVVLPACVLTLEQKRTKTKLGFVFSATDDIAGKRCVITLSCRHTRDLTSTVCRRGRCGESASSATSMMTLLEALGDVIELADWNQVCVRACAREYACACVVWSLCECCVQSQYRGDMGRQGRSVFCRLREHEYMLVCMCARVRV